jgi:hypothetical protein
MLGFWKETHDDDIRLGWTRLESSRRAPVSENCGGVVIAVA